MAAKAGCGPVPSRDSQSRIAECALAGVVTRYMTKVGSAGAREGFLFKNAAARFEVEDD
jgi:hypothetical protein